ncbi:MAG: PAAR-like domain-containing protein [Polyangiaceae bacterium]
MASTVFANDNSICCKAGPGSSPAASPDTCWTPPQPSPVPIPYPNTAYSTDLTNGTKTVFIEGTEVARKDLSYFATSVGNEPATNACGQGIMTGVIKGKAYFFSWSMNVKAETYNVCRHLDQMGHNHGSIPTNSPLFPFLERGFFGGHDCEKEEERIKRACKEEKDDDDDDKKKLKLKRKKIFDPSKILKSGKSLTKKTGPWHWTDDHCDGLNLPVDDLDPQKYVDKFKEAYDDLLSLDGILDSIKEMALDYVQNAAIKAATKVAVKAGLKQAAGSSVPAIGNAVMALWTVADVAMSVSDVAEIKRLATELIEDIGVIKDKLGEFKNVLANAAQDPEKAMWAGMDLLATVNRCLRARKCMLVPHTTKDRKKNVETSDKGGCCPGQTGHHLVPGAMVEGACPNYKHSEAPTVCVEGRNQYFGSHGRVHSTFNRLLQARQNQKGGPLTMSQAIDVAAASHQANFLASGCSWKCIKAQLQEYYKFCDGKTLNKLKPDGRVDHGTGGAGTNG